MTISKGNTAFERTGQGSEIMEFIADQEMKHGEPPSDDEINAMAESFEYDLAN